eukprot:scaffold61391_cov30-Tisochrysis_lutea.AAC.2
MQHVCGHTWRGQWKARITSANSSSSIAGAGDISMAGGHAGTPNSLCMGAADGYGVNMARKVHKARLQVKPARGVGVFQGA